MQDLVHYGVSVTLSSGAATTTSGGGYFSFLDVEGGTYTITITGFPGDASFDATSAEVTIAQSDQTATANFSGSWIRTASLMGMVTVEGNGLPGITVSISGRQEEQMVTDDNGQYTFTGLRAGNYTVEISGFDATDVGFAATSSAVEVAVGESKVWSFDGTYVRESVIAGQVSVEGNGLAGVTVSLQGMGEDDEQNTDMGGQFTFSDLRAGEYQLAISGYDTGEYGFSTTSATVRVEHGRTANVPFEGILLRTAAIMGQVSIEGEGLADVTVSLSGEGESHTTMTDNSGQYAFSDLPAGNFQVGISGYDTDDYSFETTSKNVALALGETATVPFEGILLRTSGISGRVSVEGLGLDSVTVTLSGDDLDEDMTAMTDASGQYAIAGLAEGDYTVAISGFDAVAYVFETTSMDVELGDDDTQIVNFMGMHARTASVTVRMFVDEGTKNDMHDEGEYAFPSAQMLAGVAPQNLGMLLEGLMGVMSLAGPGVHDTNDVQIMQDGSFVFAGLMAGDYQLIVNDIPASVLAAVPALQDYAYGGPAAGYAIALAVGEAATQGVPIDITHQTVNFSVTLKHGEATGDALSGATVSFFSDMAGEQKIGDAMTDDNGMASLRFARSMATNHTVHASVAAPAGSYHTSGMRHAVTWDAKYPASMASNEADIVNTMADFAFSGATITTYAGGGMALGGWAVSVSSDKSAAADTPAKLGADGSASYSEVVMADSLPVTYKVKVASTQTAKDADGNRLDGNEKYSADSLTYTHNGLSLAGTVDAGTIEVQYETQTLKVYVHHERDQVTGYTGNVLGGDERMSGMLDVDIRYIDDNGRSRAFPSTAKIGRGNNDGVYTFTNVPADHDVIVTADEAADSLNIMLLDPDERAAYTNADGATGGMFGEHGGFSHTVELCPLMATDPTGQDHGECGTFAFVSTYSVSGLVWKRGVIMSGDDFAERDPVFVAGQTVSLDPVEGKNLAGESHSQTTTKTNVKGTPRNDTHQFDFGHIASGVYKLGIPDGWRARMGAKGTEVMLGNALNPLAGDLAIDVTPTTATVYGRVSGDDGFPLDSTTVTVEGRQAVTDEHGRYIVDGIVPDGKKISVTAKRRGFDDHKESGDIVAANSVTRHDFAIAGTAESATVSGTVTAFGSGDAVGGVEIRVDGGAPLNPNAKSPNAKENDIYRTGANGAYSIRVTPTEAGQTRTISAHKDGYTFSPASLSLSTPKDAVISGINFQAVAHSTIRGRVAAPDSAGVPGGPLSGVEVKAMSGGSAADTDTTTVTGIYSLSVPAGTYTLAFNKDGYTISLPEGTTSYEVTVGLGQTVTFAQVESTKDPDPPTPPSDDATLSALSLGDGIALTPEFASADTVYTAEVGVDVDTITVMATANDADADTVVIMPADADTVTAGHQVALGAAGTDTEITVTVTAEDETTEMEYTVTVSRSDGHVVPSAPRNFTVTPGDQSATLTWEAPLQIGSSAITRYEWEASADAQLTRSGTLDPTSDPAVNGVFTQEIASPNLVNGATYTFTVLAVNTNNQGADPVDSKGPAATATAKAQPSITLTISDGTGSGLGEGIASGTAGDSVKASVAVSSPSIETITVTVAEVVEAGATAQVSITGGTIVIPAGQMTVTDTAVIKAIDDDVFEDTHNAMVQATATNAIDSDSDGTAGAPLTPASIEITDNDRVPEAPRNLTVDGGNAQLTLSWIPPDPNSATVGTSPITKYQYRISAAGAQLAATDAWVDVAGGAGARTVTIGSLTNGSAYAVEVRAVSAAGDGTAATGNGTPSS